MFGGGYFVIFIVFLVLSIIVGEVLKSRFQKYSKIPTNYGLTGKEVAEKMLRDNGIYDVKVVCVPGELTDHYNPVTKTINLSSEVYYGQNVSAAAVAAHETGHAIQHATAYSMLKLRTALVPLQNISAQIMNIIFTMMFFGALFFGSIISFETAIYIITACYAIFTLFAFVTLPVEIDASRRALAWLSNSNITTFTTHDKAKDALKWAAYTYVISALSSLAMLLYFLSLIGTRRDD